MKKAILAGILSLTAITAQAETAKVYHFDKNKKVTISKSDISTNDLQCIAKLSAWKDALFSVGATYKDAHLNDATKKQDELFMKYPHTIPTKWIDAEKQSFLIKINGNIPLAEKEIGKCL